jgi:hypothetical protein
MHDLVELEMLATERYRRVNVIDDVSHVDGGHWMFLLDRYVSKVCACSGFGVAAGGPTEAGVPVNG